MLSKKCAYCNHINSFHHDYCPVDETELRYWNQGFADALMEHPKRKVPESAKQKIYNLGHTCGTDNFEDKFCEAEILSMLLTKNLNSRK